MIECSIFHGSSCIWDGWNFPDFYYKSFPYLVESYLIEILHMSEQHCLLKPTIIDTNYVTNCFFTPDTTADWNCHCEWPDNKIEDSTTAQTAGLRILSGKSFIQTEKEGDVDNKTKGIRPGTVLYCSVL